MYNITVNDQGSDVTINSGEAVTLRFGVSADTQQQPVTNINIHFEANSAYSWSNDQSENFTDAWGAAPSDDMAYSHAYTCDPTAADTTYDAGLNACVFDIRVQVVDAWAFCSGAIDDDSTDAFRAVGGDNNTCDAYDKFSGHILVVPNTN